MGGATPTLTSTFVHAGFLHVGVFRNSLVVHVVVIIACGFESFSVTLRTQK